MSLIQTDWVPTKSSNLLLKHIIRCKRGILQPIIQAELDVHPFFLDVIFRLVTFLYRVRCFKDSHLWEREVPLPCTLLLIGSCFRLPHNFCTWLVLRGISASLFSEYISKAPSPLLLQLLLCYVRWFNTYPFNLTSRCRRDKRPKLQVSSTPNKTCHGFYKIMKDYRVTTRWTRPTDNTPYTPYMGTSKPRMQKPHKFTSKRKAHKTRRQTSPLK